MKKDAVLSYIRRTLTMLPAVPVLCFGVSLYLIAALGSDPFTSFQQGLSRQFGWSVGTASLVCNLVILALFLFLDRSLIGPGSIVMSFCIGPFIDMWNAILIPLFPAQLEMWMRLVMMLVGTGVIVIALAWYIPLNIGLQALDMAALYIGRLIHRSYGIGLMIFNVVAFTLAFFMGADWGIATFVNVLCVGKLIDWTMPVLGPISCKIAGIPFVDVNDEAKQGKEAA